MQLTTWLRILMLALVITVVPAMPLSVLDYIHLHGTIAPDDIVKIERCKGRWEWRYAALVLSHWSQHAQRKAFSAHDGCSLPHTLLEWHNKQKNHDHKDKDNKHKDDDHKGKDKEHDDKNKHNKDGKQKRSLDATDVSLETVVNEQNGEKGAGFLSSIRLWARSEVAE